ncbi:hypothetical protein ABPG77_006298 [Micractinium sp. CCAP 211/92]
MAAAAQPDDESQCMDQLLKELAGPGSYSGGAAAGGSNPFKAFARRAQLVITGLVHISVLLLPRQMEESGRGAGSGGAGASGGGSARGGASGRAAGAGSGRATAAGDAAEDTAAELAAAGFPADGSNLEEWQRVQDALERTAMGGLDWRNCCVYRVTEEGGACVEPEPPYPVSCTAAYYAAHVKQDAVIANDYQKQGPHFADWGALYAGGARSMAAAPMYVQQRVVGVLNLASKDPHAFDRSRLVWLLALVLAPFVAALQYTTQALEIESFVQRIMPPLLEQNYKRNTHMKRQGSASSGGAAGAGGSRGKGGASRRERHGSDGGGKTAGAEAGGDELPTLPAAPAGGDQFAQNAEVLITGAGARGSVSADALAPPTPAASTCGAAGGAPAPAAPVDKALLPRTNSTNSASSTGHRAKAGRASRSGSGKKEAAAVAANAWAAAPGNGTAGEPAKPQQLGIGRANDAFDPASLDPYLSGYDSDLDWGDFFFNLISMCIVYAYFSEAAVAGESQAAIVVSMCIAAIDIVLLALRWLWYEQYITYGGAVLQVFQMYRLVVLPVANTWMSWSLLNKLGIAPSSLVVALTGLAVLALIVAGVQMRFLLHAPLQLASVLFAASSTTEVCGRFFASNTSLGCMGAVSLMQLSLGVLIPSIMCHLLDMRSTDKPYLPHVQAKRWLLQT